MNNVFAPSTSVPSAETLQRQKSGIAKTGGKNGKCQHWEQSHNGCFSSAAPELPQPPHCTSDCAVLALGLDRVCSMRRK